MGCACYIMYEWNMTVLEAHYIIKKMKGSKRFIWMLVVLLLSNQLAFQIESATNQVDRLYELIKSRRSENPPNAEKWPAELYSAADNDVSTAPYLGAQEGLMQIDKIHALPGQPNGVEFDQYSGYITIDPKVGKALFYYFVESPQNSASKPLVLWLNGGPGCSSLGYGAMQELGPFRVNSDGKTLFRNQYSWNIVANVLFLESPVGVGFSYSNTTSDHDNNGDKSTAEDSYTFLINWLERFPQYKSRDFFITGESYAGHYVPQLAYTILSKNKQTKQNIINLKGIAIGNAWIDDNTGTKGMYDYFWTHAMNSDETNAGINKYCDFLTGNSSHTCNEFQTRGIKELGGIDIYNVYAPSCNLPAPKSSPTGSVKKFDPCSNSYVESYLNQPEVQKAIHATNISWSGCSSYMPWKDSPTTILPTIQELISSQIWIWIYSGDIDGRVPITSSRYAINTLTIPVETPWRPWYSNNEVGGYLIGYKGLLLITVRGAGHMVPSYQPQRALTMISFFLQGKLPPSSLTE